MRQNAAQGILRGVFMLRFHA